MPSLTILYVLYQILRHKIVGGRCDAATFAIFAPSEITLLVSQKALQPFWNTLMQKRLSKTQTMMNIYNAPFSNISSSSFVSGPPASANPKCLTALAVSPHSVSSSTSSAVAMDWEWAGAGPMDWELADGDVEMADVEEEKEEEDDEMDWQWPTAGPMDWDWDTAGPMDCVLKI